MSLTDSELSEYADEHLAYELDMLRWTASTLYAYNMRTLKGSPLGGPLSQPIANALLESFAIHTRNLIDFLYLRNRFGRDRKSDIVVEDYLSESVLSSVLPPITDLLEEAKKKADKQVAHLSSERLRYGIMDKSWLYTEIAGQIYGIFGSVVPGIPGSKAGKILPTLVSTAAAPFVSITGETLLSEKGEPVGISFLVDPR